MNLIVIVSLTCIYIFHFHLRAQFRWSSCLRYLPCSLVVCCIVLFSSSSCCSCEWCRGLGLWPGTVKLPTSCDQLNKVVNRSSPTLLFSQHISCLVEQVKRQAPVHLRYHNRVQGVKLAGRYSDSPVMYMSVDRKRQTYLDQAGHSDPTRAKMCVRAFCTNPTRANMCARSRSYTSNPYKHVLDHAHSMTPFFCEMI